MLPFLNDTVVSNIDTFVESIISSQGVELPVLEQPSTSEAAYDLVL
jgi:hypothetical protein